MPQNEQVFVDLAVTCSEAKLLSIMDNERISEKTKQAKLEGVRSGMDSFSKEFGVQSVKELVQPSLRRVVRECVLK